ncbi:hypothetical protein HZY97_10690 [Sphingomonas sp. R-74633]|uniref:hypothetical protein n=1 Tax=Sphingomonas sp. R-74633 TaxID=2751188 RepID=UPI0015D43D5A|nr:hypothetical protein [Sphingomonas sp. R-74633]NYT41225.1 hypothetical protein [Sphingomonas sp. R-74633]
MRTKLFLSALLALAPMPALADVTARYEIDGKQLVVEIDDGGNSRIAVADKFAIIRRDGVDYVVVDDKGGPKVFELQGIVDLLKSILPKLKPEDAANKDKVEFGVVAGDANVTVAGRSGAVWLLSMLKAPDADVKRHVEIVMSADPQLAPVGALFARTADIALDFMGGFIPESTQFGTTTRGILAKGAPLRIHPVDPAKPEKVILELTAVDTAEIDPKHFELPAPVTPTDEIFGSMDSLMKPGGALQNLP